MPSNFTPNYQLNQWEADDQVLRVDFNADNAKLDAALKAEADARAAAVKAVDQRVNELSAGKADISVAASLSALQGTVTALQAAVGQKQDAVSAVRIAVGSYVGNNASSRYISVGFQPKAVLVIDSQGIAGICPGSGNYTFGGLAVTGKPVILKETPKWICIEISSDGFRVYQKSYDNVSASNCNQSNHSYHYLAIC